MIDNEQFIQKKLFNIQVDCKKNLWELIIISSILIWFLNV